MEAKSQALGDKFVLALQHERGAGTCDDSTEPAGYYGDRPAVQAIPELRDDANAVARRLHEAPGAFTVQRRYGVFQQRPSARSPQSCKSWIAFIVVRDAVHEGSRDVTATSTLIEFSLADVRSFEGSGAVPDMVVTGRADATRLVAASGTLGPSIEVTPAATDDKVAAKTPDASGPQELPLTPQGGGAYAAEHDTAGAADAPPAEEWPVLDGFEVEQSARDLLGLRTGQSMKEAERIILERGGVLAAFETPLEARRDASSALAYKRLYITRDGAEALSLGSYAPDGPVLAVMRRMVLEKGMLPYEQIRMALDEKYGTPNISGEEMGMQGVRGWVQGAAAPEQYLCIVVPYANMQLNAWSCIRGIGTDSWTPSKVNRAAWQMGLPDYTDELLAYSQTCVRALVYTEESPVQWGASGFSLLLADFAAIQRADETIAGAAPSEPFEIKF